jgi:ribosomal protein S18 acetylase RimI-like enzyme
MVIRPLLPADLPALIDLTVETFRPLFEGHVRPLYGDDLFRLHHGQWEQDYRDELPTLHDPAAGRWAAVAETDSTLAGLVAWRIREKPDHGLVDLLAVSAAHRRQGWGHRLCAHALEEMTKRGVQVVEIGTGQDAFHAPARALYSSLGFIEVGIAGYIRKV